jgi:hypothetical protein
MTPSRPTTTTKDTCMKLVWKIHEVAKGKGPLS